MVCRLFIGMRNWGLEIRNYLPAGKAGKLEIGNWKLEIGNWKLEKNDFHAFVKFLSF